MTVPLKETQRESETEAIRQTALDYIEGWYTGNAERMERSLHPELAKKSSFQRQATAPKTDSAR